MRKNKRHLPRPAPLSHVVILAWKDGVRTPATVKKMAPEVTCGPHRFKQDDEDKTLYNQV